MLVQTQAYIQYRHTYTFSTGIGTCSVLVQAYIQYRHIFSADTGTHSVQAQAYIQYRVHIQYRHRHRHIFTTGTGIYSVQAQAYIQYRHRHTFYTDTYSVQTQAHIQYRHRHIFSTGTGTSSVQAYKYSVCVMHSGDLLPTPGLQVSKQKSLCFMLKEIKDQSEIDHIYPTGNSNLSTLKHKASM